MHNCPACSSFENSTQRRKKKPSSSGCMKNQSKTKEIDLELLEFQLNSEPSVVLNQTVVHRFLKAKRIINEILRSGESKSDFTESHSNKYQRLDSNSYDEPVLEVCTESPRKNSTETTLTSNTLESDGNYIPISSASVKDEISDRESSIMFYNNENLMGDAEVQFVEIPFNSNIVLNPMNNRFSFSQVDPIFINNNEDNMMNENVNNSEQFDGPKYLYNPMNNIVEPTQTSDNSDEHNNNPPDVMPADVQFSPGEYSMEDSFLNDNYNVVNTFALEPTDMEPNQNILPLMEQSSKEENLPIQFVNAVMSPGSASDDIDIPKSDKADNSKALIEPFSLEQENTFYNEVECNWEKEDDVEANACPKCHKKFKVLHYLRKHELTCGMTFHYNCLFCTKTSMLSHTIKCHMANRHTEQVSVRGIKEAMEAVIKRRKEIKETNMNILLSKENQGLADVESKSVLMNSFDSMKKKNKRKQTFPKAMKNYTFEIKKELLDENMREEAFSNLQNNDLYDNETNFKPSKEYVDALCSNCNVYLKHLKSGMIKCCPSCQSPLIYKCAVCRKCFSKYMSICGHVKHHSKSDLVIPPDDKHYCGYCNYETIQKSQLLRHILSHVREKSVKIKREYLG